MNGKSIGNACGTTAMRRAISVDEKPSIGRPSSRTSPAVALTTPLSTRISVVFPALFGPITPRSSPRRTSSETSASLNGVGLVETIGYVNVTARSSAIGASLPVMARAGRENAARR